MRRLRLRGDDGSGREYAALHLRRVGWTRAERVWGAVPEPSPEREVPDVRTRNARQSAVHRVFDQAGERRLTNEAFRDTDPRKQRRAGGRWERPTGAHG